MSKAPPNIVSILSEAGQVPERRSLSSEAADALRELILLEKLAPGTPVPERDLAEGLGISRTPLKDALRILEIVLPLQCSEARCIAPHAVGQGRLELGGAFLRERWHGRNTCQPQCAAQQSPSPDPIVCHGDFH